MNPILYIGISQSLFAGIFIATKKEQSYADKLLAALLFLISIDMGLTLIKKEFGIFTDIPPVLPLAFAPMVFLYTKGLINKHSKFHLISILHFVPFTAFFFATLIMIDQPLLPDKNFFEVNRFLPFRIVYAVTFFSLSTVYVLISFVTVFKHQKNLKNFFSFTSEKITLSWLKVVLFSFLAAYIVLYASGLWYLIENKGFYLENINPVEFSYIGLTFFSFAAGFFGYKQSEIFKDIDETSDKPKYMTSSLSEENAQKYIKKLIAMMEKDKPYLDEKLTISDLADKLKIQRHHLTQIINENLGKNFYTFVNEYRLEEVKKMMTDEKKKNYTLLAIAYECGFNSKSTFNTLFKNYTGLTPSDFRKKIQE
jgi:AraC-like DNA-binding protein